MNGSGRPAIRRVRTRHLRAALAALGVVLIAVPLASVPGRAAWTPERAVAGSLETAPALAEDAAGNLGVAWEHWGDNPGIRFGTDASGGWATEMVSDGQDWRPDLVFDAAGNAHVTFVRLGTGGGLYYATDAGGAWALTKLRTDADGWAPAIAIDGNGKLHIAYPSEGFGPGLWYFTNASGAWAGTRLTGSTWDSEPSIAVTSANKIVIAFARYDPGAPGIYVRSNASGSWVESRITAPAFVDDYPALGIDAAGKLHVAWRRFDDDWDTTLWYATNETGAWSPTAVATPSALAPGNPDLGFDSSGEPEVVAGVYGDDAIDTLYRFSGPSLATVEALVAPGERSSGVPSILRDATGRLAVAYRDVWHQPGVYLHREDPDEDVLLEASVLVGGAALEKRDLTIDYLAFERFATGALDGTSLATDGSGTWVDAVVDPGTHGGPDLGVGSHQGNGGEYVADPYLANGERLLWDTGAGWTSQDYAVDADDVDMTLAFYPSGPVWGIVPVAVTVTDGGLRFLDRGDEEPITFSSDDHSPSVATGRYDPDLSVAFVRGDDLMVMERPFSIDTPDGPWSAPEAVDSSSAWSPDIVTTPQSGTRAIAYDRSATNPGIYLARRGEYDPGWTLTRLSRSWADSTPRVTATMGIGPIEDFYYVTWVRECWGPAPGIYLATNRSGSWKTSQVVASCDAWDPSIAISGSNVTIAYTDGVSGIRTVTELATAIPLPALGSSSPQAEVTGPAPFTDPGTVPGRTGVPGERGGAATPEAGAGPVGGSAGAERQGGPDR